MVTSHGWREPVDVEHIESVRTELSTFASGGVMHLVLEVLSYALDEAVEGTTRSIVLDPPQLPDGLPRSGMSVVAALSSWLVHTNVRAEGAWSARYVRGIPDGRPEAVATTGASGASVRFLPDPDVFGGEALDADGLRTLLASIDTRAVLTLRADTAAGP